MCRQVGYSLDIWFPDPLHSPPPAMYTVIHAILVKCQLQFLTGNIDCWLFSGFQLVIFLPFFFLSSYRPIFVNNFHLAQSHTWLCGLAKCFESSRRPITVQNYYYHWTSDMFVHWHKIGRYLYSTWPIFVGRLLEIISVYSADLSCFIDSHCRLVLWHWVEFTVTPRLLMCWMRVFVCLIVVD